jgi:hypothetical protein
MEVKFYPRPASPPLVAEQNDRLDLPTHRSIERHERELRHAGNRREVRGGPVLRGGMAQARHRTGRRVPARRERRQPARCVRRTPRGLPRRRAHRVANRGRDPRVDRSGTSAASPLVLPAEKSGTTDLPSIRVRGFEAASSRMVGAMSMVSTWAAGLDRCDDSFRGHNASEGRLADCQVPAQSSFRCCGFAWHVRTRGVGRRLMEFRCRTQ